MASEIVRQFLGSLPIIESQMLPDGAADSAINTRLTSGALEPWRLPAFVVTPTKTGVKKTIYRFGEATGGDTTFWFTWTTDVDVMRAPIDGDVSERTFFTGDGVPKKTDNTLALAGGTAYPMNAYKMGVPKPSIVGTTFSVSGVATNTADSAINAAYVLTYVTAWGEEGMPSAPIGVASFKPGQSVALGSLPLAPLGNYNITAKRLYRSNTGNTGTTYQFVADIPLGQATYTDNKPSAELKEVVTTWGWEEPPDNGAGLTLGANGNALMFAGKTIYPCVPFVFYAYPPEYHLSCESDIVGIGAFGQSFAILTKSNPNIVNGIDPANYSQVRIGTDKACVSKRSIVEMMGGVVFAAKDGLWIINDSGLRPMTDKMMSEDQFKAFKPESIHAYHLDGRYYMFYDTGVKQGVVIFDFNRGTYIVESDQTASAAFYDPLQGSLYLAQAQNINKWDAGAPMTYTWRSKQYRSPWFVNPGYAKVTAEAYPVTFKLYAGGVLKHTKTVTNRFPFRLPNTQRDIIAFEVSGTSRITALAVAETGEEIARL